MHEAEIILRRHDRRQLLEDLGAISDFIDRRNAMRQAAPVDVIRAAEALIDKEAA